jgi:pilus assembly protein FimV
MSPVADERRPAAERARSRIARWFCGAGAAFLISGSAWGAGLGKLDVSSALDEPFEGVIELLSVAAEDLETIKVTLGTRSDFQRAEIDRSNILDTFVFETEAVGSGEAQITIRSTEPVSAPYVNFLISFEWAGGRIIREYTALLDPPEYAAVGEVVSVVDAETAQTGTVETETAQTGVTATDQAISETSTPVLSVINSAGYAPGNEYGPVKRGETLADIAQRLDLPSDINVYQRMFGLLKQNPDAFIRGNMNLVRQGASLTVPDLATFSSISGAVAIETYRRQVAEWEAYRTGATEQKAKTASAQASADNAAREEPTKDRVWVRQVALATPEGDTAPTGSVPTDALVSETTADTESPSAAKALSADKTAQSDETPTDVMPSAVVEGDRYVLRIIQGKAERDEALASSSSGGVISTASAASSVVPEGTPGVGLEGVQDQLTLVEEALLSSQSQNQNLKDRMALLEQQISQTTALLKQQVATTTRLLELREAGLALAEQQAKARQEAAQDDKGVAAVAAPTSTTPTSTSPATTNDTSPVVVGADDSAQQTGVEASDKTTTALAVSSAVSGTQEKIVTPEAPRGLLAQWADRAATVPLVGAALAGGLHGLSDWELGGNLSVAGVSVPVTWLLAVAALLILLVVWRVRQRREADAYDDDEVLWADGDANAGAGGQQAAGSDEPAEADAGDFSSDSIGSGFVAQAEAARGVSVTTDEVDPVAEADLYAAYGRVEQAIEVLRSAIRANPERIEFKVKLLEVLAQQGDAAAFEALAKEVSGLVEARSSEWTTIAKFGRSLDPDNPLFGKGDSPASGAALGSDESGDVTAGLPGLDLDAELDSMFADTSAAPSQAVGLEPPAAAMVAEQVSAAKDATETPTAPVNLDASAESDPDPGASDSQVDTVGDGDDMMLDFDPAQAVIEVPEVPEVAEPSEAEASDDGEESSNTIEYSLDDPLSDEGGDALAESSDSTGAGEGDIEGKLDLARAYVEIGDQAAAIELLDEIDQQGTIAQKEVADVMRKELTA